MPVYHYKCLEPKCNNTFEYQASIKTFKTESPNCPVCNSIGEYVFIPSVPYISFIDGPSGSWVTKGERFKKYRAKAAEDAARRQRDRFGEVKGAIPNYKGVELESWQEAKTYAIKDKGTESASTFDSKISQEKAALKK